VRWYFLSSTTGPHSPEPLDTVFSCHSPAPLFPLLLLISSGSTETVGFLDPKKNTESEDGGDGGAGVDRGDGNDGGD